MKKNSFRKTLKVIAAAALSAVMAFTAACPAFAATENTDSGKTYSITIDNTNSQVSIAGKTYKAYKLFNATDAAKDTSDTNAAITYTPIDGLNLSYAADGTTYQGNNLISYLSTLKDNSDELNTFASTIYKNYIANGKMSETGSVTVPANTEKATIDNLTNGYYLVYGTASSHGNEVVAAVTLTTLSRNATVAPKLGTPTLTKQIKHNDAEQGTEWGNYGDNQIGDTIEYRTITSVPILTGFTHYTYTIHDEMSNGLTYQKDAKMYLDDKKTQPVDAQYYTVAGSPSANDTFTVSVDMVKLAKAYNLSAGAKLYTYYTAVLNQNAKIHSANNPNTAYLQYSSNPYDDSQTVNTPQKTVYDWTFHVNVTKTDAKGNQIEGATFNLLSTKGDTSTKYIFIDNGADGGIHTYTIAPDQQTAAKLLADKTVTSYTDPDTNITYTNTIVAGKVKINGLDDVKEYYLHEAGAPAGYNALTEDLKIVLTASPANADGSSANVSATVTGADSNHSVLSSEANSIAFNVVNNSGSLLPSTGGIGTTIFTIIGICLMAGAAVLLITKKRMANKTK